MSGVSAVSHPAVHAALNEHIKLHNEGLIESLQISEDEQPTHSLFWDGQKLELMSNATHATATFTKAGLLAFLAPEEVEQLLDMEASDFDVLVMSVKDEKGKLRPLVGLFIPLYLQGNWGAHILEKSFSALNDGYCMSNKPSEALGQCFGVLARMHEGFVEALLADIQKCDSSWMHGGDRISMFYDAMIIAVKNAASVLSDEKAQKVVERFEKCISGMRRLNVGFVCFDQTFILPHKKATVTGGPLTKLTNTVEVRASVKLIEGVLEYLYRKGHTCGYKSLYEMKSNCMVQGDDIGDLLKNTARRLLWLKAADLVNLRFKAAQSYGSQTLVFLQRLIYVYWVDLWDQEYKSKKPVKVNSVCRMLTRLFQSFPFKRELPLLALDVELQVKTFCATILKAISRGMNLSEADLHVQAVADMYFNGNTTIIYTNIHSHGLGAGRVDYFPYKPIAPTSLSSSVLLPNLAISGFKEFRSAYSAYNKMKVAVFTNNGLDVPIGLENYMFKQAASTVRLSVQLDKSHLKAARKHWVARAQTANVLTKRVDPIGFARVVQMIRQCWDPNIEKWKRGEVVSFNNPDNPLQHFSAITADSCFPDAVVLNYFIKQYSDYHRLPINRELIETILSLKLLTPRGTHLLRELVRMTTLANGSVKVLDLLEDAGAFDPSRQRGNKNLEYTLSPLCVRDLSVGGVPFDPCIDEDVKWLMTEFAQHCTWEISTKYTNEVLDSSTTWELDRGRPLIALSLLMRNVILVLQDMRLGDCIIQGPKFYAKVHGHIRSPFNLLDYVKDPSKRQLGFGDDLKVVNADKIEWIGKIPAFVDRFEPSFKPDFVPEAGFNVKSIRRPDLGDAIINFSSCVN